jgi:hypothetical protein
MTQICVFKCCQTSSCSCVGTTAYLLEDDELTVDCDTSTPFESHTCRATSLTYNYFRIRCFTYCGNIDGYYYYYLLLAITAETQTQAVIPIVLLTMVFDSTGEVLT